MVKFKERKPTAHAGSGEIGLIVGSTKYPEGAEESAEKGATTGNEDEMRAQEKGATTGAKDEVRA